MPFWNLYSDAANPCKGAQPHVITLLQFRLRAVVLLDLIILQAFIGWQRTIRHDLLSLTNTEQYEWGSYFHSLSFMRSLFFLYVLWIPSKMCYFFNWCSGMYRTLKLFKLCCPFGCRQWLIGYIQHWKYW